ncbi:MAG: A/G-specific adenine glycosylase [Elusimicrobia bacterium]|nr:A/G-specific adenine glycosylase [Elusimicrobiota bacterium]MDE2424716.1 A/G-specific adenine glycosylase [Elusimicrobiota bacterium]
MNVRTFQRKLLAWYERSRRPLPWRYNVTPYRTWISEVMLQQTTVAAAAPRFSSFLKRFPDVDSLAAAREPEVLSAWAGLGYYSRAKNLHRAARQIVSEHGGRFPDDAKAALRLAGVGRYTAGAVLSIAYGRPLPVLDGNVARVLARFFALNGDVKSPALVRELWARAEALLERRRPGDWNQALMELGATVCLPQAPRCPACPLQALCAAKIRGLQNALPVVRPRRAPLELRWTFLWITRGDEVLLWRRSPTERFLPGHWGLPEPRHLGLAAGGPLKSARHVITRHRILARVCRAEAPPALPPGARWTKRSSLRRRLVSSLWLKCLP